MKKYKYNIDDYNLVDIIRCAFNINQLDQIHSILDTDLGIPTDPSQDQTTIFHKIFYQLYEQENSEFLKVYNDFVAYLIYKHFEDKNIVYQSTPTFRVQIPNNIAVAKWHKDKAYNHSPKEINIYLPLTKAFDSNTVWAESEEDKGDYSPMNAEVGEYYIWDGANLNHGNKENKTGFSRVSLDFRLIDKKDFDYAGTSVTTKVPMKLGHYWKEYKGKA
jgi:ectoine hydroxylase-related dioxygenase (phytanoyl-CoA dioxygenase family)